MCQRRPKFSPTNSPLLMKIINQTKKSNQGDAWIKFKQREKNPSIFVA